MNLLLNLVYSIWLSDVDFLRSTGKIYTVAIVAFIVWFTVLIYLIRLEKRVKSMEDQMNRTK